MKNFFLMMLISLPVFANVELPQGGSALISKEQYKNLTTCEKKVVNESIRVLKKDSLNADGNMVLGNPNLLWINIGYSSLSEAFDSYSFRKEFPQYFPWQLIFKATPKDTRDQARAYGPGDKFGFEVLTTLPKKIGMFSSDKDCEIVNYKKDQNLVRYLEVLSGRSQNSNGTARIFVLTNF